jgi:MFS family permease
MKRIPLALVLVLAGGSALAQPGGDPYAPPPQPYPQPPPQPYPQPPPPAQPYAPPPQQYQPQPVQLSADDHALLQQGEISDSQHIGGALTSLFFGFGIGQAVQGRYSETGWIFTLGEAASIGLLIYGLAESFDDCFGIDDTGCNNGSNNAGAMIATGLIGLIVFRVWEVVDAFGGPPKHNRRVRDLKMRLGIPVPMYAQPKVLPFVNRTRDGGSTAGLTFRF